MCRICVSLGLVRSIPESRFLVLFLACMFSLNPIFELLLGRGNTKALGFRVSHEYLKPYIPCSCKALNLSEAANHAESFAAPRTILRCPEGT